MKQRLLLCLLMLMVSVGIAIGQTVAYPINVIIPEGNGTVKFKIESDAFPFDVNSWPKLAIDNTTTNPDAWGKSLTWTIKQKEDDKINLSLPTIIDESKNWGNLSIVIEGEVSTLGGRVTTVEGNIGTMGDLETTAKSDLVSAVNEVRQSISAGGTAATITIDTSTTTEGMAKSYTIKQGESTVGVIDIPKDMVVSSGTVETDPADQDPGTYLVLTLANATSDKVYINVGTLVDLYTAQQSAAQVQLVINSRTREISATIVAGSVTDVELAANAVTTVKIADGNVTKAKLAVEVQASIDKADTALQQADVATGTANGNISVKGTDVPVKGLGSAAYTESSAYDAAGSAAAVETALEAALTWQEF